MGWVSGRERGDCVKILALVADRRRHDFWRRRRVLVTGHTGFKGAWLSLWLQSLGADVTGLAAGRAYAPFAVRAGGRRRADAPPGRRRARRRFDACCARAGASGGFVLHLAAPAGMVRRSLLDPVTTYEVNVMGTVNLLEAVRELGRATCSPSWSVTSEQVLREPARRFAGASSRATRSAAGRAVLGLQGMRGGAGRGCLPALVLLRRARGPRLASARGAGNVIGGGDWGEDRLIPDAVRAVETGAPLALVRNPHAVRPWQHVLSPLSGYLQLCAGARSRRQTPGAGRAGPGRGWNFGPGRGGCAAGEAGSSSGSRCCGKASRVGGSTARAIPPRPDHLALDSRGASGERSLEAGHGGGHSRGRSSWSSRWASGPSTRRGHARSVTLAQIAKL